MVEDVREYIDGVPDAQQSIVEEARRLITEVHPDVEETIKWNQPVYVIDGENRLYIAAHREYVNLGFMNGASLDDPDGLLDGSGTEMRHVKLRDSSDVDSPPVRSLIEQAGAQ